MQASGRIRAGSDWNCCFCVERCLGRLARRRFIGRFLKSIQIKRRIGIDLLEYRVADIVISFLYEIVEIERLGWRFDMIGERGEAVIRIACTIFFVCIWIIQSILTEIGLRQGIGAGVIFGQLSAGAVGPICQRLGWAHFRLILFNFLFFGNLQRLIDFLKQRISGFLIRHFLPIDHAIDEVDAFIIAREGQQNAAIQDRCPALVHKLGFEANRCLIGEDLHVMVSDPAQKRARRDI